MSAAGPLTEATAPPEPVSAPGDRPRLPGRWRSAALVAAVLVLLVTGGLLLHRTEQLRATPAARNHALTDTAATERVAEVVGTTLTRVLSYGPDDPAATRRAAAGLLAGKAARQYGELFAQVEKGAAEQRLTLTTHVVRTGVTRLTGRSAEVLVFLDQVAERRGRAPVTTAAQLSVTAERRSGRWLVTGIEPR
ncbi:hypothetical protein ABT354_10640 [Streptomyces sp. NPDC000594]|uniref:hypothetical protein n=1 Tax=Streptomyces sp. NPDC000594 TaxID=3154261 RepID=UPI00332C9F80